MHFPVKFRVLSMRADPSSHSVELQEIRTNSTSGGQLGQRIPDGQPHSSPPPISLFYEVDPETFSCIRVGQEFELASLPLMDRPLYPVNAR